MKEAIMVFEIKNANQFGFLTEATLAEFEDRLGKTLPTDYRDFLKKNNGGQPKPGGFWIEEGHESSEVYQFFGLHKGPLGYSIDSYIGKERYGIPEGFIPIASDGTGNTVLLKLENDKQGNIYFLDHELHPYHDPNSLEGITWLAPSFKEFISSLFNEEVYERENHKEA
jgi:hypothetical protein